MEENRNRFKLTSYELRIIGISLAILSLGLAIAYGGLVYYSKHKTSNSPQSSISTPSGKLN